MPCKQEYVPTALLGRRLVQVIPISHEKNLRCHIPTGKERVSGENKTQLPDPSREFGSVVNLSRSNDKPLQNVVFDVKTKRLFMSICS